MGLFDSLAGALQGGIQGGAKGGLQDQLQQGLLGALGQSGGAGALLQVVTSLLGEGSGGLPGLVTKFQQAGLGNIVASWISRNPNLPISADQIGAALGSPVVTDLAKSLGMGQADASQHLAQVLPLVVDALTPDGETPAADAPLPLGQIATQVMSQFLQR